MGMKELCFSVTKVTPKIRCGVFEDNSGALEMTTSHEYRAKTEHLNAKLHHFRDYVTRGEILVKKLRMYNMVNIPIFVNSQPPMHTSTLIVPVP